MIKGAKKSRKRQHENRREKGSMHACNECRGEGGREREHASKVDAASKVQ